MQAIRAPAEHTGGSITADTWHHAAIVRSEIQQLVITTTVQD